MTDTFTELFIPESNASWLISANSTTGDFDLYEQPVAKEFRVTVLAILAAMGGLGNLVLLPWLVLHRTRRSRFLNIFLHLTVADLLVVGCATAPQLAWEYVSREWIGGDFLCRIFKFFQTFSICASNYLTVAIALDRHRATRRPLALQWKVSFLGGGSWLVAALVNSPTLFLFRETEHNHQAVCRNILYDAPQIHLRIYLTTVVVLVFIAPLVVISICYLQIFCKIAQKAREGSAPTTPSDNTSTISVRSKKMVLQRNTASASLPKARVKTLRMTLVIITTFLACSVPYCIVEMWRVYGDYQSMGATTYSILAALAVSNSSTNPFVFLAFHLRGGRRIRKHRNKNGLIKRIRHSAIFRRICCCFKRGVTEMDKSLDSFYDSEWNKTLSTNGTAI